jgi:hypothetical protein
MQISADMLSEKTQIIFNLFDWKPSKLIKYKKLKIHFDILFFLYFLKDQIYIIFV